MFVSIVWTREEHVIILLEDYGSKNGKQLRLCTGKTAKGQNFWKLESVCCFCCHTISNPPSMVEP